MSSAGNWSRVRELFHAVLDQPADRREQFLRDSAAGDARLERELLSLLSAHIAADGFLEPPDQPPDSPATLEPGRKLGEFEIVAFVGAGGMGEVYRARDLRLGRDVAIKLLPPAFAADADRLARFQRESRILAALNHSNIAAIHSIEQIGDVRLLVLEFIEGPTLSERVMSGPLTTTETLNVARQLADALEAAHEHGIVHRDLKPSNVKLSPSGRLVLLDFGLAKEISMARRNPSADGADASSWTTAGMILGTCAYMSPEQARGQPVDKRTDIWAFGCILFELLAGRRAFGGGTPSDTIAALLEHEPDWQLLPHALPPGIRTLVARCLEKDAHRRLHDIADARIEIADALDGSEPDKSSGRFRPVVRHLAAAAALAAISLALGWWVRGAPPPRSPQLTRFTWTLPQGMRLESPPAVSLDGRLVAFTASTEGAASQLYVRLLSDVDATAIPRTEGAQHPFWSPDNRSVAYFARGRLMRVAVDGGAPKEISTAVNPRGGAWSRNGVIVFAPDSIYAGLSRVSENGGPVEPATLLDATQGENAHRWPTFLPDGIHFLYFVRSIHAERRGVYLGRIDRAAAAPGAPLFRSESEAVYAPRGDGGGGVLLSVAGGHIDVHPFDARRLVVTGDPTTMALPAGGNTPRHASTLSASPNLLSVVASAIPYGDRLASSSRDGDQRHIEEHRSLVSWPRVSPDGRRLVVQRLDSTSGSPDLWIEDLTRGTRLRVTEAGTSGQLAVWSPDGARLAYVAAAAGKQALTIAAADGTGVLSTIACPRARCEPTDWSPDGRWLLVNVLDRGISDVWMLSTTGSDPRPLLIGAFAERDACFSSDGNLVAYVSEEVGQPEVSVRTLDAAPRREVISVGGGTQPVWSNGGNELLFVDLKGVLQSAAVRWTSDGRLRVSSASRLNGLTIGTGHYGTQYDVSPDGQRIYYLDRQPAPPVREITLILGWQELLR